MQVPTFRSEEELVVDLVSQAGVLAHPGYFFDFPRESFLILSLLPPEQSFADGVGRLLDAGGASAGVSAGTGVDQRAAVNGADEA